MRAFILFSLALIVGGYFLVPRGSKPAPVSLDEVSGTAPAVAKASPPTATAAPTPLPVRPTAPQGGGTDFSSALAEGLQAAQKLVDDGKTEEALALLQKNADANPQQPEWRARLGAFLLQEKKDYPAASRELKTAYLANPQNDRALRDLAESLAKENNYENAVATLEQVRQAVPGRNAPALALSDLMLDHKDSAGALRVLTEAAKHGPDPQIYDRLAEASHQRKDFQAEAQFLKATEDIVTHQLEKGGLSAQQEQAMQRDRSGAMLDRAAALADQGKREEARGVLGAIAQQELSKRDRDRLEEIWQGVNQ